MFRKQLSYILIALFTFSTSALKAGKGGYEIKVKIHGIADTTVFLANFYGNNQYYKDTAKVDANGNMIFDGNTELDQGLYTLVLNKSKIIDFLVVEQKFSLESDTSDYLGNLKIKGSVENKLFYDYVTYINKRQREAFNVRETVEEGDEKLAQLELIDKEVKEFQKKFVTDHAATFAATFIKGMMEIEIPEPPKDEHGNIDSTFQFKYYKKHFLDNIDFTDARLVRTPVYHDKVSTYIKKLTLQSPDSIIKSIDYVVGLANQNYELFQYTVAWVTNTYEKSKIMGMDAIFVHMAETYYLSGQVDWVDSAQKEKIKDRYIKLKPLLIGKKAPNIILADTAQKTWYNLYNVEASYTLVYIWSPTCGHCKKITPKMHDLYLKYKDKGFKVFAVSTEYENKEWRKYIRKNNLTWINVSDSEEFPNNVKDHPLNYRENYDVYSTPQIYLLDKNKVIIAKKLEDEQLDDMLGKLYADDEAMSNSQ